MGRGRGGVKLAQYGVDYRPNTGWIAEHLMVPEANDSITFAFDDLGARVIHGITMLSAINLDDDLSAMAREIRNEVPDGNLSAEVLILEVLAKHAPHCALGIGHFDTQSPRAR